MEFSFGGAGGEGWRTQLEEQEREALDAKFPTFATPTSDCWLTVGRSTTRSVSEMPTITLAEHYKVPESQAVPNRSAISVSPRPMTYEPWMTALKWL